MAIKQLHCYCDHCANNTCVTNQLCYAEWKLVTSNGLPFAAAATATPDYNDHQTVASQASSTISSQTQSAFQSILGGGSGGGVTPTTATSNLSQSSVTISSASLVSQASQHLSTQLLTPTSNIRLVKHYNCFKKDDPLLIQTVCSETATNTSHVIRRCCHSGDYCNKDTNLLPTEEEALDEIRKYFPVVELSQQQQLQQHQLQHDNIFAQFSNQYSTLPLSLQIFLILLTLLLLVYMIALAQTAAQREEERRRRRATAQGNAFKRALNRLVNDFGSLFGKQRRRYADDDNNPDDDDNDGVGALDVERVQRRHLRRPTSIRETQAVGSGSVGFSGGGGGRGPSSSQQQQQQQSGHASRPMGRGTVHHPSDNTRRSGPPMRLGGEDFSEYSSSKANSDMAVFDTNSMASREPLIGGQSRQMHIHPGASHPYQAGPLNQIHPGPYMAEETYNGRPATAFHMTLGSASSPGYKQETSSGSGSGQPYLTQRSIAHDIQLCEVVGRGFFGVVWRGEYKGEPVAVKIFSPVAEPSWEREAEIYQTTMLRHKNILGFIATDKRHDAQLTGFWLVTDYYSMGSLFDFLRQNTISMTDAIRMAFSIANGLSHLHMEIFGTRGKPAIAHRDIKSKNILLKNDGTCCIADLGMAVRYNSTTGIVDVPTNTRIGTRRYLAPETLENKLNLMDFEAVKATDIYALGLVMWEILRRACMMQPETSQSDDTAAIFDQLEPSRSGSASPRQQQQEPISPPLQTETAAQAPIESDKNYYDATNDLVLKVDAYMPPYHPLVPIDPSAEQMREVVCVSKVRPALSPRWFKFASMRDFMALMTECWYDKPQSRLSALRVRKTLGDMGRKYFNLALEYD